LALRSTLAAREEVKQMSKHNNRVKRAFAALLVVGALATAAPATSFADGGTTPPPSSAEGAGGTGH